MQPYTMKALSIPPVRTELSALSQQAASSTLLLDASGFVAEESIALGSFTVPQQAFGS